MLSFALDGPREALAAYGTHATLGGSLETPLATRASAFLAAADRKLIAELESGGSAAPAVLVGALPFDRDRPANLFQPERIERQPVLRNAPRSVPAGVVMSSTVPSPVEYSAAVNKVLEYLGDDRESGLCKVVLARSLELTFDASLDPVAVAARLTQDRSATVFLVNLDGDGRGVRQLVGATPELLVAKSGGAVWSHPLAGSARRSADPVVDQEAGQRLLASDKDRREHAMVVEWIADRLTPWCRSLDVPAAPSLVATQNIWHLGTRINGVLKDAETPSLTLADALHPTPAVCGTPEDLAVALLRELEGFDRGYFTGAVGWTDASGDGAWYLAIRCAELAGASARLYAGAGIVRGSRASSEVAEIDAKLEVMLQALIGESEMAART